MIVFYFYLFLKDQAFALAAAGPLRARCDLDAAY